MTRTRLRAAAAAAASTGLLAALAAAPAQANLLSVDPNSCGDAPVTTPFDQFGDGASYIPVPGGSFEPTDDAWTLSGGAAVVDGNERFYANDENDTSSLSLPPGSSATSPAMCTSIYRPTLRFFVRNQGSQWSNLKVEALYRGPLGNVGLFQLGVITGSSWTPSVRMPILASLLSTLPGASTSVAFRFTPMGGNGAWSIDDVYVDPIGRR
jgi:hypothetical protein